MNKFLWYGLVIAALLSGYFTFQTYDFSKPQKLEKKAWQDNRQYPYEDFFLQKFFPDEQPNIVEIESAFRQIKQAELYRNVPIGFDHPWVVQGPGNIGARINTVTVHPDNEQVMYAGFSSGGVFKTSDGGQSWIPIFDEQNFLAIGDIVIDPNDSETIYVATGDPNISGFPAIGDGLYKSTDSGSNWEYIGLRAQRIISKIIIDPFDSKIIYATCMGLPFERSRDRGLYKSIDGGANWDQILFLTEETGVIDMVMDPFNNQVLYAAGWDRIRNNKESIVRGENADIHKSIDGGATWIELDGGLPKGENTRVGLAISKITPNTIFALYVDNDLEEPCADNGYNLKGIYKSINSGDSWDALPIHPDSNGLPCNALGGFGWYFGKLRVNPKNDNDLFVLGVDLWRTSDGGENWFRATPNWGEYKVHADKHDLVFTNSGNILLGTDGGLYKSDINTTAWEDIENIPATQFYRVAYNPHTPDLYYGGAQDNGTTGGNQAQINEWERIYGADGFQTVFHPLDPNKYYAESQNGSIRVTLDDGVTWRFATEGIDSGDSRNWDTPYLMSSHDPDVLYVGTDKVYRSETDTIPFWNPISLKLTEDENDFRSHNISALSESPLDPQILYAATTDALVWETHDGGVNWSKISTDLPYRYVSDVIASPTFQQTVYASHSGYKDNDNTPLIHRSDDGGTNWINIAGDFPAIAINEMMILPEREDSVLFAGTDAGVYASINGGTNWHRLGSGMPLIPVYDLVWNEGKNELVVGTFARGILSFPLDEILDLTNTAVDNHFADEESIQVYPNPSTDGFWLELEQEKIDKTLDAALFDVNGKLLYRNHFTKVGKLKKYFEISDFPKGIYFLKLTRGGEEAVRKVIKN